MGAEYPILYPGDEHDEHAEPIVVRMRLGLGYWADADPRDYERGAAFGRRARGSRWQEYGRAKGLDDLEDQLFDDGWFPDPGPVWVVVRK